MITYKQLLALHEESRQSNIETLQLFYRSLYEVRDNTYITSLENSNIEVIFHFEMNGNNCYILKDDYNTKILEQKDYQDYIDWHKIKIEECYQKILKIEQEIQDIEDKIRRGLI